jgi:hypothetical protein
VVPVVPAGGEVKTNTFDDNALYGPVVRQPQVSTVIVGELVPCGPEQSHRPTFQGCWAEDECQNRDPGVVGWDPCRSRSRLKLTAYRVAPNRRRPELRTRLWKPPCGDVLNQVPESHMTGYTQRNYGICLLFFWE